MPTPERVAELAALGYYVEDMGEEHGDDWIGHYRWMNDDGEFQDAGTSSSPEDAWAHLEIYLELI